MTDESKPGLTEWQQRYGAQAQAPESLAALDLSIASLLGHRSVRAFLDQPVTDQVLETAIASAQSASTSSNLQAWSVIAVRDPDTRAELATLGGNQKHIAQAPLFLAWVLDLSRLHRLGAAQGLDTAALDYLEMFMIGTVDVSLAAQNAAIVLEAAGLGLVYIGGMRNHPEKVAALLGLPPKAMVLFGMCVGHPDPERLPTVKPRLPQSVILHHERYGAPDEAATIARYDSAMREAMAAQSRLVQDWSKAVVERVSGPEKLSGRDRLREALGNLGFPLL